MIARLTHEQAFFSLGSAEKPYLLLEDQQWKLAVPTIQHQPLPGAIKDI